MFSSTLEVHPRWVFGGTMVLLCAATNGCGGDDREPNVQSVGVCRGVVLPEDAAYVAPGLCVRAVANEQTQLRQLMFTPDGVLIGVTMAGSIRRYRDLNDDGMFEGAAEVVEIAQTGGDNGNNAHLEGGYLYAGSPDGVKRWAYSEQMDDLGEGEDVVVGQPSTGTHKLHTVHVYDGWLYVHSGSEDNAMAPRSPEYDTNRAVLKRFELSEFVSGTPFQWTDGEVYVSGLRNMVGFTRNGGGRMYGVVNGLDNLVYNGIDVHLDNPGDDLPLLVQGEAHGYPFCFTAQHVETGNGMIVAGTQLAGATDPTAPDPDFSNPHDDAWCAANSTPPATFTPAHAAPLDIVFFEQPSSALPAEWAGGAFITLHGSWNTSPSVGHRVIFMPFDGGRPSMPVATQQETIFPFTVVFGGGMNGVAQDGEWAWASGNWGEDPVRPVGVAISPVDGALYVSSDNAGQDNVPQGAIYRIRTAQ